MVAHIADVDTRLLKDLAGHRLFPGFARFDEAGERRIHALGPDLLAAQQGAVAVMYQHDHRRVGARKIAGAAVGVGAIALVAAFGADGGAAADTAKSMAGVPEHQAAGIGHHGAFEALDQRSDFARSENCPQVPVIVPPFPRRAATNRRRHGRSPKSPRKTTSRARSSKRPASTTVGRAATGGITRLPVGE